MPHVHIHMQASAWVPISDRVFQHVASCAQQLRESGTHVRLSVSFFEVYQVRANDRLCMHTHVVCMFYAT